MTKKEAYDLGLLLKYNMLKPRERISKVDQLYSEIERLHVQTLQLAEALDRKKLKK